MKCKATLVALATLLTVRARCGRSSLIPSLKVSIRIKLRTCSSSSPWGCSCTGWNTTDSRMRGGGDSSRLPASSSLRGTLWPCAGHWVEEQIPPSAVVGEPDWTQRIDFSSHSLAPVYYVLKWITLSLCLQWFCFSLASSLCTNGL